MGSSSAAQLLAPCDVQAIKACGVTFAVSLLERVIEEQAGGDASKAEEVRATIHKLIGADLSQIKPGSEAAAALKAELERRGAWSQYMEVGIGPDAEVFTKSQPMSSVGFGASVGLHPMSEWNNPEPEIVLARDAGVERRHRHPLVGPAVSHADGASKDGFWRQPRRLSLNNLRRRPHRLNRDRRMQLRHAGEPRKIRTDLALRR